jgi:hypothetical protein
MAGLGQSPSFPKAEQQAPEWQLATEMLLLVAEHGGDTMMPRNLDDAGAAPAHAATGIGAAPQAGQSRQDRPMTKTISAC